MDDTEFDRALVASAFTLAAEQGWSRVSVTAAARAAGLPLDRARGRFLGRTGILARFGRIADQSALAHASSDGSHRDRLFDLVMRRIDVLQSHRGGVLGLRDFVRREPMLIPMLALATALSMAWMLEAAGISAQGGRGRLRTKGMVVVWLCTVRAWARDTSEDLSATMKVLDRALDRAERAEAWLHCGRRSRSSPAPDDAAPSADMPPPAPMPPPPLDGNEPPLPPPPTPIEPPPLPAN